MRNSKQLASISTFFKQPLLLAGPKLMRLCAAPATEWLMLFICLLPFLVISAFNHPTDDDFQGAVLARHLGLWESVGFYYQHWTGRYTSSFLYGLVYEPVTLHSWLWALRFAPVVLLFTLIGASYFAIGGLGSPLSESIKWRLALYGVLLYLCGIPLVASALYWFNGAAVYTAGILLALMLMGLIGRCIQAENIANRTVWGSLATIDAVLLVGTNELMAVTALVGITAWLLTTTTRTKRSWPIILLIATSIGTAITIIAPGNFLRAATMNHPTPWWYRLGVVGGKSIYLTVSHAAAWASSGLLLAATVLLIWWLSPRQQVSAPNRWLYGAAIGGVVMPLLTIPTLWLTNDVPARVWNVVYFLFLLCWFAVVQAVVAKWPLPLRWRVSGQTGRSLRVLWLLLIVLGYNSAVHRAYVDVAFKAQQYDAAQQQRYVLLQQLQRTGRHNVEVPALLPYEYQYPGTIFLHELELFSRDIANEGMASYFGLDSVRVRTLPARIRRHMRE